MTEPPRDFLDRAQQLVDVGHAFLQEVGAPFGTGVEELERVPGFDVLTQDHDADLGVVAAQLFRGADPFVGARRRHTDVGDDDVGVLALDRGDEIVEVFAGAGDLDLG